MRYRVISAANDLLEPPNLFIDRVPARSPDQALRVVRGKDGGDGSSLDGSIPDSTIGRPWGLGAVKPGARIRIAAPRLALGRASNHCRLEDFCSPRA